MAHEYRSLAKERLAKARKLLDTNYDDELIYSCLELRKCVEGIVYEQLKSYLNEVPPTAYQAWQPDKVIKELLQCDPIADSSRAISMQREATETETAGPWQSLGEDRRLKVQRAAQIYHRLGSFIHVPTIKQMEKGTTKVEVIRASAEAIYKELDHVLSARIWGGNFGVFDIIECAICKTPIKRRESILKKRKQVQCGSCGQLYLVEPEKKGGGWCYTLVEYFWNCDGCGVELSIPQSKAKPGLDVSCLCGSHNAILTSKQTWGVKQWKKEDGAPDRDAEAQSSPTSAD